MMMKLFRQRVDPSMGEVMSEDELLQAYAMIGITWVVHDEDQIFALGRTVDRGLQWVVGPGTYWP